MPAQIGLDLGTYAVKLVQMSGSGSSLTLEKAAQVPNSVGSIAPVDEREHEQLVSILDSVFEEAKIQKKQVQIGIPESSVSTKIVAMPSLSDQELASAIPWQAEQYIPIPADDLQLEYQVLYRPTKRGTDEPMRVLLVGAAKSFLNRYVSLFYDAGIDVSKIVTNTFALYSLLMSKKESLPVTLLVNVGATATEACVVHNGEFAFVHTFPTAGTSFSRTIQQAFDLQPIQAEEYKRSYGLDPAQLEGKMKLALEPVFGSFIMELQKVMQYFSGSYKGVQVQRILVTGGSSMMENFINAIAERIPVEVGLLSPTSYIQVGKDCPTVDQNEWPSYSQAIGIALGKTG
jgi:type IV pilus assembly protein PilM